MAKISKKNSRPKKKSFVAGESPEPDDLDRLCDGLQYISETDAPLIPFRYVSDRDDTRLAILDHFDLADDEQIEQIDIHAFFGRLVSEREWYGERELAIAHRFRELHDHIVTRFDDVVVLRVGAIRIDIFCAGRKDDRIAGFRTLSVET